MSCESLPSCLCGGGDCRLGIGAVTGRRRADGQGATGTDQARGQRFAIRATKRVCSCSVG
jgi:hypothetical protein